MSKYLEWKYLPYLCCAGLSLCREGVDHIETLIHAPDCLHCREAVPGRKGKGGHKRKGREWKQASSLVLFPSVPLPLAKLLIGRRRCKHGEMSLSCPLNVLLTALSDAFGGNRYPEYSHQILFKKKDSHSVSRCGPPQVQSKKAKHALTADN